MPKKYSPFCFEPDKWLPILSQNVAKYSFIRKIPESYFTYLVLDILVFKKYTSFVFLFTLLKYDLIVKCFKIFQNEYYCTCIPKLCLILECFGGGFHQAKTSYFWRVKKLSTCIKNVTQVFPPKICLNSKKNDVGKQDHKYLMLRGEFFLHSLTFHFWSRIICDL